MQNKIKAKVVADSISEDLIRITTLEIEYPRIVHSEFLKHRMLSSNSASSRAIPFNKMCEQLTGEPVVYGSNKSGMQDGGSHSTPVQHIEVAHNGRATVGYVSPEQAWLKAKEAAVYSAKQYSDAGYHKQVFNRLTEPFQTIKCVVTATEWTNFFWLRDDDAADPTIRALAKTMRKAIDDSVPMKLSDSQWHLPYVYTDVYGKYYLSKGGDGLELEDAKKVSVARCAAVSYRNVDYTLDKCKEVWGRLIGSDRKHASAFEHQAKPMYRTEDSLYEDINISNYPDTWENGVSHMDRQENLWSGNIKGWIQLRKTIDNESL